MKATLLFLPLILVSLQAIGEINERIPDFKTDGRIYTNAHITSVTDGYAIVMFEGGGKRVKLQDLPEPFRSKYYNPEKAAKFLADENKKKSEIAAAQVAAQNALRQKQIEENKSGSESLATAFGVQLGQKFLPRTATATREGTSSGDLPMYGFKPKQPSLGFSEYWVRISPHSNLIWQIFARGDVDHEKAFKFRKDLLGVLEEKYGTATHSTDRLSTEHAKITKGDLEVSLNYFAGKYLGNDNWEVDTITLCYEDKSLEKRAKNEAGGKGLEDMKKGL